MSISLKMSAWKMKRKNCPEVKVQLMCKSDFHFLMVDWKADQVISVDSLSLYYW